MGRRRKKSDLERWVELFAKLPWVICLVLAPIAYIGFAALADLPSPRPADPTDPTQMSGLIITQFVRVIGLFGQYMAPLVLLLAALLSFMERRRRRQLLKTSRTVEGAAALRGMGWQDFERLMHAWFEEKGYTVVATPAGADGGIDLILKRHGETFLVQCKQWRATRIGVSVVRELYGVMVARGATGGFVVGIGEFTEAAREFATGRNLELVDASRVVSRNSATGQAQRSAPTVSEQATPTCPRCSAHMVRRVARKGANAGNAFYGCSRFPNCRATQKLDYQ